MTNVLAQREGEQRSGGVVPNKLGAPRPPLRDLGSQPPPPDTARLFLAALSCRYV